MFRLESQLSLSRAASLPDSRNLGGAALSAITVGKLLASCQIM